MKQTPSRRQSNDISFSPSQIKIILAAETLFARSSIESVSMRQIAIKAKQKNHYAVQYHFGSRDRLVEAVYSYRMLQMEDKRAEMLAEAEQQDRLHDIRALLDMVFLPQLFIQDAEGNHSYAHFLCQFLLRQTIGEFGDFGVPSPPHLTRVMKLLRIRLGYLPPEVAQRRLIGVCLVFLNILINKSRDESTGNSESFADALNDTMAQIELAMCMPLSDQQKATGQQTA